VQSIRGALLHNAEVTDGKPSADRNGIILDLYHGDGGGLYSNRAVGPILVEDNDIADVAGRGIQMLRIGQPDSPWTVQRNKVHGRYAYMLGPDPDNGGESHPVAGIGGYGAGVCSSGTVSNNDVAASPDGKNAYEFDNFDGGDGSGVKGSGNKGRPAVFDASPGNSPPAGFLQ
jgi:hypothetical protein